MAVFRSRKARRMIFWGVAILAVVVLPVATLHFGGCSGGESSGMSCTYIPDAIGNLFFGIYLMMAFSGLILLVPFWGALGLALAVFGVVVELVARLAPKR